VPDVRYQVPGVPPAPAKGISAFTPAFVRHAASSAQQYKETVRGYPGTRGIPVTARQDTQISADYGDLAMAGTARSSDAPDTFWPNQYYAQSADEPPGAAGDLRPAYYSPQFPGRTTLIPVPAEDPRVVYQVDSARLARPGPLQRVAQLPWFPRVYSPPNATGRGNSPVINPGVFGG